MARSSLTASLLVVALVLVGLKCCFVPAPQQVATDEVTRSLRAVAVTSGAALASAAPALAREIDGAEAYNRKVLEAQSYFLMLSLFLGGTIVYRVSRDAPNRFGEKAEMGEKA